MKPRHRAALAAILLFPALAFAQDSPTIDRIEAKWGAVMRRMKGWDEAAIAQFRQGYRDAPAAVLEKAFAARTFEDMQRAFDDHAVAGAQKTMAKAYPLGATQLEDLADPRVVEAHRLGAKTLGEDARDLVFIPVTPCTVWDTRFATDPNSAGIVASGVTRRFYTHLDGAGGSFATWGGNPSCPETAQNAIGGRPYAVMMTVFTNDATGNGWVTVYRDGDPDPSQATISVYYAAGPTKTQTVIAKSSRGYGAGLYDVAVTSRFASVHVAAVVTGYFIKPQATTLQCKTTFVTQNVAANGFFNFPIPSCPSGYSLTGAGCFSTLVGDADWAANGLLAFGPDSVATFCSGQNLRASQITINGGAQCCRIPGR